MRGMGAPSVEVRPGMSFSRGPSTSRGFSRPDNSEVSIAAPASPPSARPTAAPNGPPTSPPTTDPAVWRTSVAMGNPSLPSGGEFEHRRCRGLWRLSGKAEHAGEVPAPPRREGHLADGGAVVRVDHSVRGRRNGAVLGGQAVAPAEQEDVAGPDVAGAAEIEDVGEAVAAGREGLVATGRDGKRIAGGDRFRRALPQVELGRGANGTVGLDLDREPCVRAARPGELARREPAVRISAEACGREAERAVGARHRGGRAE